MPLTRDAPIERALGFLARAEHASPVVAAAHRMAREHRLGFRESEPLVLAARGVPRLLYAEEAGVSQAAMDDSISRALDKLGAHSIRDVVDTLLREIDRPSP